MGTPGLGKEFFREAQKIPYLKNKTDTLDFVKIKNSDHQRLSSLRKGLGEPLGGHRHKSLLIKDTDPGEKNKLQMGDSEGGREMGRSCQMFTDVLFGVMKNSGEQTVVTDT